MEIKIKNRWNGNVIISGEYEDIKDALQKNRSADFRGANLCEANLCEANLAGANLSRTDLFGANLSGANLSEANLSEANLARANLCEANLCGADLSRADLGEANLARANLCEAKGVKLPIINIIGSSFHFFYMDGIIKIGCEHWPIGYWIENYEEIGHDNDFTPEHIAEYGGYIKMVENLIKEKK